MQLQSRLYYFLPKPVSILILIIGVSVLFLMDSCVATKTGSYFKTLTMDTTLQGFVTNDFESKIQKKDVLGITVSSMNKDLDDKFNAAGLVINTTQTSPAGYHVNDKGEINVHYAGVMPAAGLTRKELKLKLEQTLLPFLKEPIITVQYLNHKVTILGEVERPQVLNMPEEQLSLIDAIVLSGDVKENAKRNSIMIIREEKDTKTIKHLNLEDHSIFSSPWYYIQPNDIVYVLPDAEKYAKEEKRRKFQTNLSLAASLVSLAVIILNLILR